MNDIPLTIVSLDVTNFARLRAVRLEPDPTGVVTISGRNAQGKSSVLDAIATVIDSSKHKVPVPVHLGADEANIVAVLGREGVPELVVKWKATADGKKSLVVEDADGIKQSAPASLMKSLFGYLSVDPFAFAEASDDEQIKTLLGIVGFDVDEWQTKRKNIFDTRTVINREVQKYKKTLSTMQRPKLDTPDEPIKVRPLLDELAQLGDQSDKYFAAQQATSSWSQRVTMLKQQLAEAEANFQNAVAYEATLTPPDTVRMAEIKAQLEQSDEINREVEAKQRWNEVAANAEATVNESKKLSAQLLEHDKQLQDALTNSEVFPVQGIAYDGEHVTYHDLPFASASTAEKLTIGTALAMAAQPDAGVILIRDGSLLDGSTTDMIRRMAENHGMQVWIETVDTGHGFLIEDGEVRA